MIYRYFTAQVSPRGIWRTTDESVHYSVDGGATWSVSSFENTVDFLGPNERDLKNGFVTEIAGGIIKASKPSFWRRVLKSLSNA